MDIALLPVARQVLPGAWEPVREALDFLSGAITGKRVSRSSCWSHCRVVCLRYSGVNCSSILVGEDKNWF